MAVSEAMPVVFLGHGNPLNAIQHTPYAEGWHQIAAALPRPRAVLSVSAHWYVEGTRVTTNAQPRTIHDFGGFPRELYEVQYPAPGSPELAARVRELLGDGRAWGRGPHAPEEAGVGAPAGAAQPQTTWRVKPDDGWGLDHGTWAVLVHMFPDADIPVVQLAIDETLSAAEHYRLAEALAPLRDEGVLILGSGNAVHNLHAYAWGRSSEAVAPFDWAVRFETRLRGMIDTRDLDGVVHYESLGRDARLAAPTPDHFLPLLYVLAQHRGEEPVTYPVEGVDGGSVSMLCVRVG